MTRFNGKNKRRMHTAPIKSIVLKIVPELIKKFDSQEGKPMWLYGAEQKFASLQEAVDCLFPMYPALKPYATLGAIELARREAEKAAQEEDEANMASRTTDLYWDCECEDSYIHPRSEEICGSCGTKREDGPDSHVSEVKAMGYTLEVANESAAA